MKMGPYKPQEEFVKLDDSLLPSVEKLLAIKSEMEIYGGKMEELKEKQKELLVSDIFPVFGDSNKGNVKIDENSWYEITLRAKPRSAKIDEEKLKAEHPDIYERYTKLQSAAFFKKVSLHPDLQADYLKAHPSKFETSKFAKEHPDLYEEYFVPDGKMTETKMNYCEILYKEKSK